jgi:hypothetical protein
MTDHGCPVGENAEVFAGVDLVGTVDNARKQQELIEMSPIRQFPPAGYQRRHGEKVNVSTGEALGARRRNLVEEATAITSSGKCRRRHQGGGSGRSTVDGRSYGEGLETDRDFLQIPRQPLTRQETFRFLKQSYHLEDMRAMKYRRLKNSVVLVTAAAYFAATFLGQKMKLRILCEKLLIISQRFFGIPPFRFYALSDGIKRILSGTSFDPPQQSPPSLQMDLTARLAGRKILRKSPLLLRLTLVISQAYYLPV